MVTMTMAKGLVGIGCRGCGLASRLAGLARPVASTVEGRRREGAGSMLSRGISRSTHSCRTRREGLLAPDTSSSMDHRRPSSYKDAIQALNSLQTNAQTLASPAHVRKPHLNVPESAKFLEACGVTMDDLDSMKIIHVSGTKGKGSTCAFCESLLLQRGLKTGMFTSPHLVSVRERIRINGVPIGEAQFATYFWEVMGRIHGSGAETMPAYFKFLTIMALYIFSTEKVDVAIIEVGIGGLYDCTNVIRKPVAVGITSLGLDHTKLLGNTIEEIAFHKAGIIKSGAPAFTTPGQPPEALEVIQKVADEKSVNLYLAPPFKAYDWGRQSIKLSSKVQALNAALALQLCQFWLQDDMLESLRRPESEACDRLGKPFKVGSEIVRGLQSCNWPGRSQVISKGPITYFLDGAHTVESVEAGVEWFEEASKAASHGHKKVARCLLFNSTGDRDARSLLHRLISCGFNAVVFCTNNVDTVVTDDSDQANMTVSRQYQLHRCQLQGKVWMELLSKDEDDKSRANNRCHQSVTTMPSISAALEWLGDSEDDEERPRWMKEDFDHTQILVMGSLHLVGGVLAVIQPDITSGDAPLRSRSVAHAIKSYWKESADNQMNRPPGTP